MSNKELLIIGPVHATGGGITELVSEHKDHLKEDMDISTYDVGIRSSKIMTLIISILKLVAFPFRSRPDIIHIHSSGRFAKYRATAYALQVAYLWKRPAIFHLNGSAFKEPDSRILRGYLVFAFRSLYRFIVVSEYWKMQMRPFVNDEKLIVIPNPIDTGKFSPNFEPSASYQRQFKTCKNQIVFMATFVPRKGINEFLEAIKQLEAEFRDEAFCVTICGDGPLRDEVEAVANEYVNVEYLGFVSGEEKRDVLASSSIYVLQTQAEGLPVGLLEGMATGNAVVTTPVTSIPEVVKDGVNGWLIKPGDVEQLVEALRECVQSPNTVKEMAETNRKLMVDNYDWSKTARELKRIYEKAV